MAQNISLLGVDYPSVPAVNLPKTEGGIALFTDVSDSTAEASDVADGKVFYLADGSKAVGEASGGSTNLTPIVLRPDAELIEQYTYDKYIVQDEGVTLSSYSTTAKTLKASETLDELTVDTANYDYYLVKRMLTIPEYSIETKAKGRSEFAFNSYLYELAKVPANTVATLIDPTKKVTTNTYTTAAMSAYRLLYWSSASAVALYSTAAYGTYQTAAAPTLSGSTWIIKSPAFGIRGHATYFTSTYYNALTDIRYQYAIDVYRAPKNNLNVDGWTMEQNVLKIIDCVNTDEHTLT